MITIETLKKNIDVTTYIKKADESLLALGFTEHSFAHVTKVAQTAKYILENLDYDENDIRLAEIAAYLHDIGNLVNREEHSQSGAVIAFRLLDKLGMSSSDISTVVTAIGNHDEGNGVPVNPVAAALILADKSDVRRSRVRNRDLENFDIHDRVNYSVTESKLEFNDSKDKIELRISIDTSICSIIEYFEIFMKRMLLCKNAANKLGVSFKLFINGQELI
jgi:HD superfamily phosphodiesterase